MNLQNIDREKIPSVYRYSDYREYLVDLKRKVEEDGSKLSYETLAEYAGIGSRTQLKKVFKGKMGMPKNALESLCKSIGLNREESNFLNMLRLFNESKDSEMSLNFYKKVTELRKKNAPELKTHELEETQLKILEKWFYLPVLSYLGLKGASSDVFQIVKSFKGQLSIEEVSEAIRVLVSIKLLKYTEDGQIVKSYDCVSILDGIPRPLVRKFHSFMINRAHDSISGMPQDKRHLMSGTLTVKESMLPEIKSEIVNFMKKMNENYSVDDADSIYQLNTQLFNLAVTK